MDRRQNNGIAIAQRLVHCAIAVSAAVVGKDNVRCTAVEEQPEAKEVQLSQPSSTSPPSDRVPGEIKRSRDLRGAGPSTLPRRDHE